MFDISDDHMLDRMGILLDSQGARAIEVDLGGAKNRALLI